jgi:hypothetical protein
MDSPFFPALVCFGPFFLILFVSALTSRGQERQKVPRIYIYAAFIISLGIGIAGAAAWFLS